MKVFISWSGDFSKSIAEILREWIPGVIQAVKPYYSPDDITKGTRWSTEISKELDASKVGIICLTKENLESPWIMFEAGALSKNIEKSKVVPILFGIEPSDIQGPLVQFQASKFSKSEMKKTIKMINSELGDDALDSNVLDSVFDMWWPKLEEQIEKAEEKAKVTGSKDLRSDRDLLEEVLTLTREISINRRFERERTLHPKVVEDLISSFENLTEVAIENSSIEIIEHLKEFHKPMEYLIEQSLGNGIISKELYSRYRKSRMRLEDAPFFTRTKIIKRKRSTTSNDD